MSHTPGPWKHDDPPKGQMTQVFTGDNPRDGFLIGYVLHESLNDGQRVIDEANAKLIAAAPELLEALNEIIEQADRTDAGAWLDVDSFKKHVCGKARAAIAKATA